MPSFTRLLPVLIATGLLLTGCDPAPPAEPAPTTPHAPRFASDEEALAAAEEAYAAFMAVSDQVVRDGGTDPERLRPYMTEEMYEEELAAMGRIRAQGRHGVGSTQFELILQAYDDSFVAVYVCDDQSATDLLDSSGTSVVNPEGLVRVPFEVAFDAADDMRLAAKTLWTGGGVC